MSSCLRNILVEVLGITQICSESSENITILPLFAKRVKLQKMPFDDFFTVSYHFCPSKNFIYYFNAVFLCPYFFLFSFVHFYCDIVTNRFLPSQFISHLSHLPGKF